MNNNSQLPRLNPSKSLNTRKGLTSPPMGLTDRISASRRLTPLPQRKTEKISHSQNQKGSETGRPTTPNRRLPALPNTLHLK